MCDGSWMVARLILRLHMIVLVILIMAVIVLVLEIVILIVIKFMISAIYKLYFFMLTQYCSQKNSYTIKFFFTDYEVPFFVCRVFRALN